MRETGWTFTSDRLRYAETVVDFLREDPIRNAVSLHVALRLPTSLRAPEPDDRYGWWTDGEDGRIRATFHLHVPRALMLSTDLPERAAAELPAAWLAAGLARPTGVFGLVETAAQVSAGLVELAGGGYRPRPKHEMRLFSWDEPAPPDPAPRGESRLATLDDLPLLVRWERGFAEDCEIQLPEVIEPFVRERIEDGRAVLWTVDGEPVATASFLPVIAATARILGVYTPPEQRRKGYAAGVTWDTGRVAERKGAKHVLLHTDLSNPTSNAIYRRLGYRPIHDVTEFEFTE